MLSGCIEKDQRNKISKKKDSGSAKEYSEPWQTFKMERLVKIVNG